MNVSCKIIIREVVTLGTIAATIILMGDEITTAILYSKYFGFIRSIPFSMGWIIFALAAIWLTCRLKGYYKRLDHPFFYASFIYWFFFFFGGIDTKLGLNLAMGIVAFPVTSKILASIIKGLVKFGCKTSRQAITLYIKTCRHLIKNETLRQKVIINDECWFVKATKKRINNKTPKNKSILKYDHFEKGKPLHEGRTEIVDLITSEVKKLYNSKHSFTIGLEGGWGSGKSTLLNAIIENLKGNKDDHDLKIEVVEFSPWAFPEGKNLSVEFLYEIRRVLIKHSFRARFVVNSYINVLTGSYNLGALRMLTSLLFPRESLTDVKRKLSEIICHHKLKLVVVIDDLDRLDKPEIAEVFKMLRNTGELSNSVYLVAYDRLKIEEMGEFCNGFLDKIINVEVDLNPFDSVLLLDKFINKINHLFSKSIFMQETNFDKIYDLQRYPDIIKDISTPRDIVRLENNLRTRVGMLENIFNGKGNGISARQYNKNFLVFLEILKLKHSTLYDKIKKQLIYNDSFSNVLKKEFYGEIKKNKKGLKYVFYNDPYKKKLAEYLNPPTKSSPNSDYILRIALRDYFATSSDQIRVTNILSAYLNSPLQPDNAILEYLNKWEKRKDLYSWALLQIPIILEEASRLNKSENYCMLIANLIVVKEYCDKLFDLLFDFCKENGNISMFKYINKERSKTYTENISGGDFTHIDKFCNSLVREIVDSSPKDDWFFELVQGQEERLGYLLDLGRLDTARDIYCVVGKDENSYYLSDRAIYLLREYSRRYPYKYFTELAFHREECDIITSKFNTLFYMTREELTELVNEIGGSESLSLLDNLYSSWETFPEAHFMFHEEAYSKYELFVQSLPGAPVKRSVLAPL